MKQIWPGPEKELSKAQLAAAYPWPQDRGHSWLRANMVMSLDGSMTGPDGLSKSISSPADRVLLGLLRRDADVILVGAKTIRAENYRPAALPMAIVSNSLDLPADLAMFAQGTADTPRSMVLTSRAAIAGAPGGLEERIDLIACGAKKVDLKVAIAALTEKGLTRIHCEGGPALLADLLVAGLLDELLLTISPVLLGLEPHLVDFLRLPAITAEPEQVLFEDGSVFLRYSMKTNK